MGERARDVVLVCYDRPSVLVDASISLSRTNPGLAGAALAKKSVIQTPARPAMVGPGLFVLGAWGAMRSRNPRFPAVAMRPAFLHGKLPFPDPFPSRPQSQNSLRSFVLGAGIEPATLPSSGECSTN